MKTIKEFYKDFVQFKAWVYHILLGGFDPTSITGYNPATTQTLKNVSGTLTWIDG